MGTKVEGEGVKEWLVGWKAGAPQVMKAGFCIIIGFFGAKKSSIMALCCKSLILGDSDLKAGDFSSRSILTLARALCNSFRSESSEPIECSLVAFYSSLRF